MASPEAISTIPRCVKYARRHNRRDTAQPSPSAQTDAGSRVHTRHDGGAARTARAKARAESFSTTHLGVQRAHPSRTTRDNGRCGADPAIVHVHARRDTDARAQVPPLELPQQSFRPPTRRVAAPRHHPPQEARVGERRSEMHADASTTNHWTRKVLARQPRGSVIAHSHEGDDVAARPHGPIAGAVHNSHNGTPRAGA